MPYTCSALIKQSLNNSSGGGNFMQTCWNILIQRTTYVAALRNSSPISLNCHSSAFRDSVECPTQNGEYNGRNEIRPNHV